MSKNKLFPSYKDIKSKTSGLTKLPFLIGAGFLLLLFIGILSLMVSADRQNITEEESNIVTNENNSPLFSEPFLGVVEEDTEFENDSTFSNEESISVEKRVKQTVDDFTIQALRSPSLIKIPERTKKQTSNSRENTKQEQPQTAKKYQVQHANSSLSNFVASDKSWKVNSEIVTRSPYTLFAGSVIPSILITAINSDLSGQLTAMVSRNVYDTVKGSYLLIPQGTKLIGEYSNAVIYGQSQLLVAWQRLIFPNGESLDIGAMQGSSLTGAVGFSDQVNHHYFKLFSGAMLMTAISFGAHYTQDKEQKSNTFKGAMGESLANALGEVGARLLGKNLSIAPTLEIRTGFRFNVQVMKDIEFKQPYGGNS